jgi:hypothetical protein
VPVDLGPVGPGEDGVAGELATIVADDHLWLAALEDQAIKLPRHSHARKRRVGDQAQTFPRAVVDDGQDAEATAVGQLVGAEALYRHGKPKTFNTDQGSQFTSQEFTGLLIQQGVAIRMDGKGDWRDNVFVERLWRSVKYEEVYLRAYASLSEARSSIGRYLTFYNTRRPHQSLDRRTPDQTYFNHPQPIPAAA